MIDSIIAPGVFDPDAPGDPAGALVDGVGGQVVHLAETLAPICVPFVLAMVAIRWVLQKFALRGSAGLSGGVGYEDLRNDEIRERYGFSDDDAFDYAELHGCEVDFDDRGNTVIRRPNGSRVPDSELTRFASVHKGGPRKSQWTDEPPF